MTVADQDTPTYGWMRPLLLVGRFRAGIRAAVLADAARLRELNPVIGRVALPLLAIAIPAAISVIQATTPTSIQANPNDVFALIIYDVFTESIPFMAAAVLIGMLSPAAGALLVLTYAVGNVAATVVTAELTPVVPALFGRLVSFWLFWLLAVEIPLAARYMVEWWSYSREAPRNKRVVAVMVGGLTAALLTQVWAMAAPLLITPVFLLTSIWGVPFVRAVQSIGYFGYYISITVAVAGTLLLGVRYLGPRVIAARWLEQGATSRASRTVGLVVGLVLTVILVSGLIHKPVDAAILIGAILAAPWVARAVLRATRLARPLSAIAWPIRIVIGFGAALLVAWVVVGVVSAVSIIDSHPISRWFPVVVAVAVTYFVVQFFMAADDVAASTPSRPSVAPVVTAAVPFAVLVGVLALPAAVAADDWNGYLDIPESLLKDAAAGIGAMAAWGAGLFGGPPPPPQGPPRLPPYEGPPGQEQGPKPRSERGGGPGDYSGPQGQDVPTGPPPLRQFTPPGPAGRPPPPPPPWYLPDGAADFLGFGPPTR